MEPTARPAPLIFNILSVADVAQTAKLPRLTFPGVMSPLLNRDCDKEACEQWWFLVVRRRGEVAVCQKKKHVLHSLHWECEEEEEDTGVCAFDLNCLKIRCIKAGSWCLLSGQHDNRGTVWKNGQPERSPKRQNDPWWWAAAPVENLSSPLMSGGPRPNEKRK